MKIIMVFLVCVFLFSDALLGDVSSNNAPKSNDLQSIRIKGGDYVLLFSEGNPNITLYNLKSHRNVLEVLDTNNDGIPDLLRYSSFDASGRVIVESTDCEFDGQVDVRWHFPYVQNLSYLEIWNMGRWYRIQKGPYIEVEGRRIAVEKEGGCYRVVD